ncbi:MAG: alkaline phosphatase, partial [Chloroflexi bacterium]|nr:alkaline phosphatase [Chloroflexota bacterium]
SVAPLWQALEDFGADVVLAGHDHSYERFARQTAAGVADPAGIREFVVGTGGRSLYGFGTPVANSEVRSNSSSGILKLTLYASRYTWQFLPVAAGVEVDSGGEPCHW